MWCGLEDVKVFFCRIGGALGARGQAHYFRGGQKNKNYGKRFGYHKLYTGDDIYTFL